MKSSRRRAREFALQGLYQWLLGGDTAEVIQLQLSERSDYKKIDVDYFSELLAGVIENTEDLCARLQPCLDRPILEVNPVERAILLIGAFELKKHLEIPYKVVINEAVEVAKTFSGTDAYKYINGVLDKLAKDCRLLETETNNSQSHLPSQHIKH
jgi:transcription antitermination protein NusB